MSVRGRVVLLAAAVAPVGALACGVCIEDKIAATYDHAVITRAAARHQVVVFASLDGFGDARALARDATTAASRVNGIERDSVRAAAEPPALSFALDPSRQSAEAALGQIEKRAATPGLKLTLLRVVR
jgi:hypothetical protein